MFWAQQVAEKALKSYWIVLDLDAWGHSVTRLIDDLPADRAREEFASRRDAALYLDKLYIPTKYPDAIAELTPSEAYTRREAETRYRPRALVFGPGGAPARRDAGLDLSSRYREGPEGANLEVRRVGFISTLLGLINYFAA